ncbi:unnamed protein product, partial [Urochloa humidicola]
HQHSLLRLAHAVLPVASHCRSSAAASGAGNGLHYGSGPSPRRGFPISPARVEGSVAAAASSQGAMAQLPSEDYFSEVKIREHGEKINKYQGMLAARLKAKYFSNKFFEKEDVFEEIVIQSETIRLSRWPFTRLFADPAKFSKEKSYTEKDISPSLVSAAMSNN